MLRTKLSVGIAATLIVVTTAAYFTLSGGVERDLLITQLDALTASSRALLSNKRQAETSLRLQAEALSRDPNILARFDSLYRSAAQNPKDFISTHLPNAEPRRALWDALDQWRASRARPAAPRTRTLLSASQTRARPEDWFLTEPDLLLAFLAVKGPDASSTLQTLIAYVSLKQNSVVNVTNETLKPLLDATAAQRQTTFGVVNWPQGEKGYVAAATPVIGPDGAFLGTLILGYQLSNDLTQKLTAALPEHHLLMIQSGLIYSTDDAAKQALTSAKLHVIQAPGDGASRAVEVDDEPVPFSTIASDRSYRLDLNGTPYLLTRLDWFTAPEVFSPNQPPAHLLILDPLPDALLPLSRIRLTLPLLALFAAAGVIALVLLLLKRFIQPIQRIEAGIREVLQGNKDYRFDAGAASSLHANLSTGLNQMTAYLQGKSVREDEEESGWDQVMVDLEPERPSIYGLPAVGAAKPAASAAQPQPAAAASPPDPTLQALYDRYIQARAQHNQPADMDYDRFVRRLRRNEAALKDKHGCKAVEFSVAVNDGKVVLKPKLLY